jgi:hypothetical protein
MKIRCALLLLATTLAARAFPPSPPHTILGLVRDELGQPITTAKVIFETSAGVKINGQIVPNLQPGVNYSLTIPMDAGLTDDAYKPTALRPAAPFRIKVQIGETLYLPIQMKGDFSHLGAAAGTTRIDLTLGEDSDGDGLPDAWELALISQSGGNLTLADITPGDDFDHDGISNHSEYVAGTYAFDSEDGFRLTIAGMSAATGKPLLDFLAIRNHTYTLYGSSDLASWTRLNFRIPAEGADAALRANYSVTDVRQVRVEADLETGAEVRFFKLLVQ